MHRYPAEAFLRWLLGSVSKKTLDFNRIYGNLLTMSRHDISDELWRRLEPHVHPQRADPRGRPNADTRRILNGVIWVLRTGAPWRDLPDEFGPWQTVYKRFNAWAKTGVWATILKELSHDADFESIILDGSYVRTHQHATGARGGLKARQLDEAGAA
jgi:transposase